jgi:hypothetical protein
LKQQTINLPLGTVLRFSAQFTIINPETDVFLMNVLPDDNGAFLVGWTGGIRPEVWNSDMWPEMSIAFANSPVCQKSAYPDAHALRVTLLSGSESCQLDSVSGRCCTLGGVLYEVVCTDAWHDSSGAYPDYAYLFVARRDLLPSAP